MKFLSVFRSVERNTPPSPQEMERMGKLVEEGMEAGHLLAVEGCLPTVFGARVRKSKEKIEVTDGPFSEAKEVIGGLAVYQVTSKEEAIKHIRAFLDVVGDGECELRQLFEEPQDAGTETSKKARA